MSFDPFGDFETKGYLRNIAGEKDELIIEGMEELSVEINLDRAFSYLQSQKRIEYKDVLEVHRILFSDVYPWAGQDRTTTAPDLTISRKPVTFANAPEIRPAVEYGLKIGNDPDRMADRPGEVMGMMAYGHPFLDGNGRALMVTHTVLAERAGISIDWGTTNKTDYLKALTAELHDPQGGHLDRYLEPFISKPVGKDQLASHLKKVKGLNDQSIVEDEAYALNDPEIRAQYEQQHAKYEKIFNPDKQLKKGDDKGR